MHKPKRIPTKKLVTIIFILLSVSLGLLYFRNYFSNKSNKTVTLIEGYNLKITIPKGYRLTNGKGDYTNYIENQNGVKIIGFQNSTAGGETNPIGQIDIDNIPFTIDYRKDIGCPASIYPTNYDTSNEAISDLLYVGINTWCDENTESSVYDQIIQSIKFSPQVRDMLLGNKQPPQIR